MITKSWWENWRFRIRGAIFLGAIAAILSAHYFSTEYDKKVANGWYFEYLNSTLLVKSGIASIGQGKAKTGQKHAEFLATFCSVNKGYCNEFDNKSRLHFVVMPSIAAGGIIAIVIGLFIVFGRQCKKKAEEHMRGAQITDAKKLKKILRKEEADIYLGGVPWPKKDETHSLLLAGSPGSGKSVAINTILKVLRRRGDRVILVDAGGQFIEKWARAGDVLLNPFDSRSKKWSPFAEGDEPWEIEAMARSLIPPGEGSDAIWSDLAYQVMSGLLEKCREHGIATNAALAGLAAGADAETLTAVLDGHPAKALVASGSPATIGSILTNLTRAASGFRYLPQDAGEAAFSITNWVKNETENHGWMFLSYEIDQRPALKSILAAQLDLVARAALSLRPDDKRRIWLIVDELPLLGKVASISEFLTNGRKYGGCAVLGIQALSQLRETYGKEGSQTMLSCLATQLILNTPDPETAELMSKLIGEHEILRETESEGRTEQGTSKNKSEQIVNSRVVMPSELQTLPKRSGYLNLLGDRPTTKIKLEIPKLSDSGNPHFLARKLPPRVPFVLPPGIVKSAVTEQSSASTKEQQQPAKPATTPDAPTPAPTTPPIAAETGDDWLDAAKE